MDRLLFVTTFLAALGAGLMAGVFFAFSVFILKALGSVAPKTGIAAMQSLTATIKNPLFLTVFFGTAALSAVLAIVAVPFRWSEPGALWLVAGSTLYLTGPFTVTLLRNVPLNNQLAQVEPGSAEGKKFWDAYLPTWTNWNHVRTAGALAAAACFIMALVL
jgi:uncharacterized membrane protein